MAYVLSQRRVILGITGGIAAYKAAELARALSKAGAQVQVVMTDAAKAFVTPLTLQALTGMPVRDSLLDPEAEAGMGHIELARWAELILIAPATADCLARLASGRGDDLLTTLVLATPAPVHLAPAMNQQMWAQASTQDNLATLIARGVQVLGVSIDSHFSHLAWRNTPRSAGGIGAVSYPLIADLDKKITEAYDVLLPAGIALRGLFLIDREGVVRHQVVNDLPLGRSVDEALRMVDALQFFEKHGEVCPANWKEGADTIKPDVAGSKTFFEKTYK